MRLGHTTVRVNDLDSGAQRWARDLRVIVHVDEIDPQPVWMGLECGLGAGLADVAQLTTPLSLNRRPALRRA
jgi:hypothetical protein